MDIIRFLICIAILAGLIIYMCDYNKHFSHIKIHILNVNNELCYIVQTRNHWWNSWKMYLNKSGYPKIFYKKDEIVNEFELQPWHL